MFRLIVRSYYSNKHQNTLSKKGATGQTGSFAQTAFSPGKLLFLFFFLITPLVSQAKPSPQPPNILFVIMDDVGMDQMRVYGYENDNQPQMPTIQAIADEGVKFRNAWSMPACSTSRAVFFTGRYPLRTHVLGALGQYDLANSQVSPYEITLPVLLKQKGYSSALFGKFHLGLQDLNPFKEAMPNVLGWDYFYGWLDETGDPFSIDTTAGGVGEEGEYSCGFVPGIDPENPFGNHGADYGACYTGKGKCEELTVSGGVPPGRACRDSGGILDPQQSCQKKMPSNINKGFQNLSGHYVSPLYIIDKHGKIDRVPLTDSRARTFRGSAPVDAAIDWINRQPTSKPWMASISFASAHTPTMQPPQALLNSNPEFTSSLSCATSSDDPEEQMVLNLAQREITNYMIEALDFELARLLVSLDLATYNEDGSLNYTAAENKNTMIIVLGDNGTLGNVVKIPFTPSRAKGTAYQTGVWVPLLVAGPMVEQTNREVTEMVNIVDLYQLFGEIAGIEDVQASVPRKLDSEAMLPYLTNSATESIRNYNFTQVGTNEQADQALNGPCVIQSTCTQIPVSKSVCTDNAGTWYGIGSDVEGVPPDTGLTMCCQVNQLLYTQATTAEGNGYCDEPIDPMYEAVCDPTYFTLQPLQAVAIRNDDFKVVRNTFVGDPNPNPFAQGSEPSCDPIPPVDEFYSINEDIPPRLDREGLDLLDNAGNPPLPLKPIYEELAARLDLITHSEIPCPQNASPWTLDGNQDGVVNEQDLADLEAFAELANGGSSWYDVNLDGNTDGADYTLVQAGLGTVCAPE